MPPWTGSMTALTEPAWNADSPSPRGGWRPGPGPDTASTMPPGTVPRRGSGPLPEASSSAASETSRLFAPRLKR